MKIHMKKGKVVIDGREFTGNNFQLNDNKLIVDGVQVDGTLIGDVSVTVHGDVESLEITNGEIKVSGNTGAIHSVNGNVFVNGDSGNIKTINGNITTKSCIDSLSVNGIVDK